MDCLLTCPMATRAVAMDPRVTDMYSCKLKGVRTGGVHIVSSSMQRIHVDAGHQRWGPGCMALAGVDWSTNAVQVPTPVSPSSGRFAPPSSLVAMW